MRDASIVSLVVAVGPNRGVPLVPLSAGRHPCEGAASAGAQLFKAISFAEQGCSPSLPNALVVAGFASHSTQESMPHPCGFLRALAP